MFPNSNTSTSCKSNLSFFKKRMSGNATLRPTNSCKENSQNDHIICMNPTYDLGKKLSLDFEIKMKLLEEECSKENIKMEKIKELLELYAVLFYLIQVFLKKFKRKQLNIMTQLMMIDICITSKRC